MLSNIVNYYHCKQLVGIMVRVFSNGMRDQGSIPDLFIPKNQKMVLDAFSLNTQHYRVSRAIQGTEYHSLNTLV